LQLHLLLRILQVVWDGGKYLLFNSNFHDMIYESVLYHSVVIIFYIFVISMLLFNSKKDLVKKRQFWLTVLAIVFLLFMIYDRVVIIRDL